MNALRATELGVFEWIARDREIFLEEPLRSSGNRDKEAEKEYALELTAQFNRRVSSREPRREEVVKETLSRLFPYFNAKLKLGIVGYLISVAPDPSSQKISLQAGMRSDYLERFFAGDVPATDVADQPTLQYIRSIERDGYVESDFTVLYLDTREKMTGPLNKMVQFAALIRRPLALQICDTILDWIAVQKHAAIWPEPERFMEALLPDVFGIVRRAGCNIGGRHTRRQAADREAETDIYEWSEGVVNRYMPKAPLLSVRFAKYSVEKGSARVIEQLPRVVFNAFRSCFIEGGLALLPTLSVSRFSLSWLLGDLCDTLNTEEYGTMRPELTKVLISEINGTGAEKMIEKVIFSLVQTSTPVRSGDIRLDEYLFGVDRDANERRYDMSLLLPVVKNWSSVEGDPVTERALAYLRRAYDFE